MPGWVQSLAIPDESIAAKDPGVEALDEVEDGVPGVVLRQQGHGEEGEYHGHVARVEDPGVVNFLQQHVRHHRHRHRQAYRQGGYQRRRQEATPATWLGCF